MDTNRLTAVAVHEVICSSDAIYCVPPSLIYLVLAKCFVNNQFTLPDCIQISWNFNHNLTKK